MTPSTDKRGALKVLDLFCGAGGAAMGLYRAWPDAEITGVDIALQPRYPFRFAREDVLGLTWNFAQFDFVWASPPCQRYSSASRINAATARVHHDLIAPTRERLLASGVPFVIENVVGAPLISPVLLCGSMFSLRLDDEFYSGYLRRHRLFESNFPLRQPPCAHDGKALGVFGHGSSGRRKTKPGAPGGISLPAPLAREIMGISWMNRNEVAQAIPPAYSEYIAHQYDASL